MIDGRNVFDKPVRNNIKTKETLEHCDGQGDGYLIGCLLDYHYFNKNYKLIAIDLSKQQAFDADRKTMQKINFTGNLENKSGIFFIIEEAKETVLNFLQGIEKYCECVS